jgi:pre-mRNA-splicing factor ATP-dependent RNA helicase DHX38/PRP16
MVVCASYGLKKEHLVHNLYQIIQSYVANMASDKGASSNGGFTDFTSKPEQLEPSNGAAGGLEKGGLYKPTEAVGGLSVPKFKAPAPRTSALGLDKLAAQKRQEAEDKARSIALGSRGGASRSNLSIRYDEVEDNDDGMDLDTRRQRSADNDERGDSNNKDNDMGSVPFRKRHRDEQQIFKRPETPSHPGGVDSNALDRIKSRYATRYSNPSH